MTSETSSVKLQISGPILEGHDNDEELAELSARFLKKAVECYESIAKQFDAIKEINKTSYRNRLEEINHIRVQYIDSVKLGFTDYLMLQKNALIQLETEAQKKFRMNYRNPEEFVEIAIENDKSKTEEQIQIEYEIHNMRIKREYLSLKKAKELTGFAEGIKKQCDKERKKIEIVVSQEIREIFAKFYKSIKQVKLTKKKQLEKRINASMKDVLTYLKSPTVRVPNDLLKPIQTISLWDGEWNEYAKDEFAVEKSYQEKAIDVIKYSDEIRNKCDLLRRKEMASASSTLERIAMDCKSGAYKGVPEELFLDKAIKYLQSIAVPENLLTPFTDHYNSFELDELSAKKLINLLIFHESIKKTDADFVPIALDTKTREELQRKVSIFYSKNKKSAGDIKKIYEKRVVAHSKDLNTLYLPSDICITPRKSKVPVPSRTIMVTLEDEIWEALDQLAAEFGFSNTQDFYARLLGVYRSRIDNRIRHTSGVYLKTEQSLKRKTYLLSEVSKQNEQNGTRYDDEFIKQAKMQGRYSEFDPNQISRTVQGSDIQKSDFNKNAAELQKLIEWSIAIAQYKSLDGQKKRNAASIAENINELFVIYKTEQWISRGRIVQTQNDEKSKKKSEYKLKEVPKSELVLEQKNDITKLGKLIRIVEKAEQSAMTSGDTFSSYLKIQKDLKFVEVKNRTKSDKAGAEFNKDKEEETTECDETALKIKEDYGLRENQVLLKKFKNKIAIGTELVEIAHINTPIDKVQVTPPIYVLALEKGSNGLKRLKDEKLKEMEFTETEINRELTQKYQTDSQNKVVVPTTHNVEKIMVKYINPTDASEPFDLEIYELLSPQLRKVFQGADKDARELERMKVITGRPWPKPQRLGKKATVAAIQDIVSDVEDAELDTEQLRAKLSEIREYIKATPELTERECGKLYKEVFTAKSKLPIFGDSVKSGKASRGVNPVKLSKSKKIVTPVSQSLDAQMPQVMPSPQNQPLTSQNIDIFDVDEDNEGLKMLWKLFNHQLNR